MICQLLTYCLSPNSPFITQQIGPSKTCLYPTAEGSGEIPGESKGKGLLFLVLG